MCTVCLDPEFIEFLFSLVYCFASLMCKSARTSSPNLFITLKIEKKQRQHRATRFSDAVPLNARHTHDCCPPPSPQFGFVPLRPVPNIASALLKVPCQPHCICVPELPLSPWMNLLPSTATPLVSVIHSILSCRLLAKCVSLPFIHPSIHRACRLRLNRWSQMVRTAFPTAYDTDLL